MIDEHTSNHTLLSFSRQNPNVSLQAATIVIVKLHAYLMSCLVPFLVQTSWSGNVIFPPMVPDDLFSGMDEA